MEGEREDACPEGGPFTGIPFSPGEQTGKEGLKSGINVADATAAVDGKATGSRDDCGSKNAEVVRLGGDTCISGPFGTEWSMRLGKTGSDSGREWRDKEWVGLDGTSMRLGRTSDEGTGETCKLSTSSKCIDNEATAGWVWSIDM